MVSKSSHICLVTPTSFCATIVLPYLIGRTLLQIEGILAEFVFTIIFGNMQSTLQYQEN